MSRLVSFGLASFTILLLALTWSPAEATEGEAGLSPCPGDYCNKWDPDVDCWDGEIYWQFVCTEGEPWCDGKVTVE